ncbi:hypothetical protein GZ77_16320 [Endozoicomonas montiporae]|uniref:Peptide methionine sulfoxide reductase MsrA n=2 Tax=Endozoicomonas montiporae TaxID=1027273 RepID=A0A081N5V7_9GAMM|nr:peptide-methionine (S)-S-oxide reductase MsrA [Endozoicomonas montiporae]AMO57261.1 peptide methionine sulfoxide reductase [Endozoicomonas montiporae CL-33]KEQ13830.1 hypothetical protein GZ77_16320 [Endozoicomonas montiporae]
MTVYSKQSIPSIEEALPGRKEPVSLSGRHFVHSRPILAPFPDNCEVIYFGMGCFWGAERLFWKSSGVWTTAVGYSGGHTPNPSYEEVCSGGTGHAEVVLVVFDPALISAQTLLKLFWESHDPTQGMRQGNDIGTQYRSVIYTTTDEQYYLAEAAKVAFQVAFQSAMIRAGKGVDTVNSAVTTEVRSAPDFYYAEEYHQQYLAKHVNGYCGLGGAGVCLPTELPVSDRVKVSY